MKKKIIVPVDFSAASHNAYLYARGLAVAYEASIEVIHVYEEKLGEKVKQLTSEMEKLKTKLTDFIALYPKDDSASNNVITKVEVNIRLLRGVPVQSILELVAPPNATMVVMGMTGSHNAVGKFWGTTSTAVAQKANCPVLLIPNGVKYQLYDHILYASNYESSDDLKLKQITAFAEPFDAVIHFIHVKEEGDDPDFTAPERRIFEKIFENGDPSYSFTLASIDSESVPKGLNQYADENDIDLIVLVNNQRGFFETMLGYSMTKKMAFHSKLPLMVFHLP